MLLLVLVLTLGCSNPRYVSIKVPDSDTPVKVKILGEFSRKDYKTAQKSLELLKYLAPDLVFTNSPKLSWMDSKDFAGLTIMEGYREVFIDKNFKVKKGSGMEYFEFLVVYVHALAHFERDLSEAEVQSLVDGRLFLIYQKDYQKILDWH